MGHYGTATKSNRQLNHHSPHNPTFMFDDYFHTVWQLLTFDKRLRGLFSCVHQSHRSFLITCCQEVTMETIRSEFASKYGYRCLQVADESEVRVDVPMDSSYVFYSLLNSKISHTAVIPPQTTTSSVQRDCRPSNTGHKEPASIQHSMLPKKNPRHLSRQHVHVFAKYM